MEVTWETELGRWVRSRDLAEARRQNRAPVWCSSSRTIRLSTYGTLGWCSYLPTRETGNHRSSFPP